jgi:hypothetical protein
VAGPLETGRRRGSRAEPEKNRKKSWGNFKDGHVSMSVMHGAGGIA